MTRSFGEAAGRKWSRLEYDLTPRECRETTRLYIGTRTAARHWLPPPGRQSADYFMSRMTAAQHVQCEPIIRPHIIRFEIFERSIRDTNGGL